LFGFAVEAVVLLGPPSPNEGVTVFCGVFGAAFIALGVWRLMTPGWVRLSIDNGGVVRAHLRLRWWLRTRDVTLQLSSESLLYLEDFVHTGGRRSPSLPRQWRVILIVGRPPDQLAFCLIQTFDQDEAYRLHKRLMETWPVLQDSRARQV
jgi:hypothetical protein